MDAGEHPYITDRADSTEYEPMLIDGIQVGEARLLRGEGSRGNAHEACLWRTDDRQATSTCLRAMSHSSSLRGP